MPSNFDCGVIAVLFIILIVGIVLTYQDYVERKRLADFIEDYLRNLPDYGCQEYEALQQAGYADMIELQTYLEHGNKQE